MYRNNRIEKCEQKSKPPEKIKFNISYADMTPAEEEIALAKAKQAGKQLIIISRNQIKNR